MPFFNSAPLMVPLGRYLCKALLHTATLTISTAPTITLVSLSAIGLGLYRKPPPPLSRHSHITLFLGKDPGSRTTWHSGGSIAANSAGSTFCTGSSLELGGGGESDEGRESIAR
ncbi:hypothetical protein BDK51DRAFT_27485 [Blyttiomyces helicus]|uniref:Uncharacterized protein n=1 Tax=Blyttiomyces helicus TaxID=388810 RepID=A0A4P9W8F6_9FUNG|nr:hypothetical protein BDK51DRAFT_27485 [Blyttiomyces helicus]|eukprot:RKO88382.1 hypothetical protein BDK51DRAFT_27485 [Blyttiomyces helicus]